MFEIIFFSLSPILFSVAGAILALYIFFTKRNKAKQLICPIGGHCDAVVSSKYSKFLGLPVELLGSAYYVFIIIFYGVLFVLPGFFSDAALFFVTSFSVVAFLFSVYLVFIQAFVLRNWCTWCLFSAGFTTFIAIAAVFGASFDVVQLLSEYRGVVVFFHALAAAIGVGATTVTDVLFFKFLKDYKISKGEQSVMETMSHIIWVALALLIVTGVGLYVPASERLLLSSKFLVKVVAVAVITINGLFLNFMISPRMTRISFGKDPHPETGEPRLYRKLAFACGAISISSWYVVFLLGSIRSIPLSFRAGLALYVGMVLLAIIGSQVYDKILFKKRAKNPHVKSDEHSI